MEARGTKVKLVDEPVPDDVTPKLEEVLIAAETIESTTITEVAVDHIDAVEQLDLAVEVPSSTIAEEIAAEEKTTETPASGEDLFIMADEEPDTISPEFEDLGFEDSSVSFCPSLKLHIQCS